MLNKLAPVDNEKHDSLSNLLADEKLNGTRERDLSAPRPDYYYFRPGSKYLLVEDATARHRPVMIKEYTKELEWPIIHDQFLRLTTSSQLPPSVEHSKNLVRDLRERAWSLYVENTRGAASADAEAIQLAPRNARDAAARGAPVPRQGFWQQCRHYVQHCVNVDGQHDPQRVCSWGCSGARC